MFKSKMWGIGWNPPATPSKKAKGRVPAAKARIHLGTKLSGAGLKSIPGRTARLKAIYLLQIAAEIEHALMVQYLYAAYSLNELFAEGEDDRLHSLVVRWKRDIRSVARQEMGHLITVQNLLLTLGAEANLDRENNFLLHPDAYPFPVRFEQLSLRSLAKYVVTESPELNEIDSRREREMLKRAMELSKSELVKINRVGVLYVALYWLFLRHDESSGPWKAGSSLGAFVQDADLLGVHIQDEDFVSIPIFRNFEATPEEWGVFEEDMKVSETDPRSRALAAIHWIMAQGEGPVGRRSAKGQAEDNSHFKKFLIIFEEFKRHQRVLRGAVRDVPENPLATDQRRSDMPHGFRNTITEPEAKLWAQLFNNRYQILLIDILLALSTSKRKDPELRQTLLEWGVVHEMKYLQVIGQILPTLHRHSGSKDVAGAPFETTEIPADAGKRWDMQRVLMKGSDHLTRRLRKTTGRARQALDVLADIRTFDAGRLPLVLKNCKVSTNKYHWRSGKVSRVVPEGSVNA